MTQTDQILMHLKAKGKISGLGALRLSPGVYRLSDVIWKLRGKGHNIKTHMIPRTTGAPYAEYHYYSDKSA